MKKLSILLAVFAAALGFSSCEEDKDPVVNDMKAKSFVLNTPALADQYYELTEDGTLDFTVLTQPDYGFVASVTYGIQIALSDATGVETYDVAPLQPNSTHLTVNASDVAMGMCSLLGIEAEEDWTDEMADPRAVYVRATAQLGEHESSLVYSNWVTLKQVSTYFAVPLPGYIYLVGSPEGWSGPTADKADHYAEWRLFEKAEEIGSKVYYGTFEMPAAPMFRFYTALTGWDADSYGSQVDDSPIDVEINADGTGTYDIVKGKGSFNFPKFAGGTMTIVVDMSKKDAFKLNVMTENE